MKINIRPSIQNFHIQSFYFPPMKQIFLSIFIFSTIISFAQDIPNERYPFDPAREQPKNKGEVIKREFTGSTIYPGTKRDYWIYVPTAYTPDKPACLYVAMDGISFDAPTVFDNLIASGEMPVTIGVFVGPGTVYDANGEVIRYNRSNEFDKTDDTFVRFLLEELLPDAEKQTTSDGRAIRISRDPNDRAISGNSSGAICAFTAAWFRPDAFSKVFSTVGTYVPMRGGNEYPALIRKTEPKPIRIFLQDGEKDTWNPLFGSWFDANLNMQSALSFAGYEVAHAWGTGGHDGIHANNIFPDVMRWLWKGWPRKIQSGPSKNSTLEQILDPDAAVWEEVAIPFVPCGSLYSEAQGDIFVCDANGTIYRINVGETCEKVLKMQANEKLAACFGQKLYGIDTKGKINIYENGKKHSVAGSYPGAEGLLVTEKGMYIAQRMPDAEREIWLLDGEGKKTLVDRTKHGGMQMTIFPDHRMLVSTEENSHWMYNDVIGENATLTDKQRWYWLHNTENYDFDEKGNLAFDITGNLYVATTLGVQICDHNGRVRAILTLPSGKIDALCFGGENLNTLYVISGNKLYKRKLKVNGATPDMPPVEVPSQGQG